VRISDIPLTESSKKVQPIIGLVSLALAVYGFTQAGVLGVLTGVIAGFGVGSGLSILGARDFTEVSTSPSVRAAQRLGGLISAVACAAGVYAGGWALGSLLGMAGYACGMVATVVLASVASRRAVSRTVASTALEQPQADHRQGAV